jgi:hypothetical protein
MPRTAGPLSAGGIVMSATGPPGPPWQRKATFHFIESPALRLDMFACCRSRQSDRPKVKVAGSILWSRGSTESPRVGAMGQPLRPPAFVGASCAADRWRPSKSCTARLVRRHRERGARLAGQPGHHGTSPSDRQKLLFSEVPAGSARRSGSRNPRRPGSDVRTSGQKSTVAGR